MISFKDVKKTYTSGGKTWTLGPLSFEVQANSSVAIIGSSGSGKSTILHLCGTLLKPTSGSIIIDNQNLSNFKEDQYLQLRNETIGFIFQNFHLFPEFTLLENVAMPLLIKGIQKHQAQKKAGETLNEVGLNNRKDHYPRQLSGGQIQRGAIARALVIKPKIILADEPTGNLDQLSGDKIIKLLQKIQKNHGSILLLATHDKNLANICSNIITINNGKMIN